MILPRKQTVNRRYNQFVYGGPNMGKIFEFNKETVIKFQKAHDYRTLLLQMEQIKTEESRAYHKFVIMESDDNEIKQIFAFFIHEILLNPEILERCLLKIKKENVYLPGLYIAEIERQIRRNRDSFDEFKHMDSKDIERELEILTDYFLMRFEVFFLNEMLKTTNENIVLVIDNFRPEFLHDIPQHVKGIIIKNTVEDKDFIRLLSSEYEIPIAQCSLIYPTDKIAIINEKTQRITFNPDDEDLEIFHKEYNSTTFNLGEKPSYMFGRIKIYAQAINSNNLDRIESFNWYNGIAPFKTEYFFITNGILPTIEEQVEFFVDFFMKSKGMPIYLRVPDFMPSKPLKYMNNIRKDTDFFHNQHNLFFDHFTAVAKAVKLTNADVKICIPRVVMASELSDWRRHVVMAFEDEGLQIPEFGYVLETESAFEYYSEFPRVDFIIIGFNDLIEENTDFYNRFTEISVSKFNEIFVPVIKDIHAHLYKRGAATKHILAGNVISNPGIFRKLINYGFTDFSIPVSKIRLIEETFTEYCITRGRFVGVYRQARLRRELREQSLKELD